MCHKVLFWIVIGTPTKESWTKIYALLNIDTLSVPMPFVIVSVCQVPRESPPCNAGTL